MTKYALITGASGGIGSAVARKLYSEGYSLYLHYNTNLQALLQLQTELSEGDKLVHLIQADLSKSDGVPYLLSQLNHSIDTVIFNAGTSYYGLITDMTTDEITQMIQLQTTSPFVLIQALLPEMIKKKFGHIVMISSIWGITGASCEVLYSMVKGGQNSFVKALAKEVAPSGVRVNSIAPGAIQTNMLGHLSTDDMKMLEEEIPMGRLGKPEEVAEAVAFLISNQSSYMTGQVLSVNGGWFC